MVLESVLVFLGGLFLLVKGSDYFVEAAAKIAKMVGISDLVIGLTIVSLGTSLPEAATSLVAVFSGQPALSVATIIGSNIANIALILALAAVMSGGIKTEKKVHEKIVFFMVFVAVLFFYFVRDGVVSSPEGYILLALLGVYTAYLLGFTKRFAPNFGYQKYIQDFFDVGIYNVLNLNTYLKIMKAGFDPATYRKLLGIEAGASFEKKFGGRIDAPEVSEAKKLYRKNFMRSFLVQVFFLIVSGVAVSYGANFVVDGAISLSEFFGIQESLIGLFLIAIGTSLPELSVSLSAAKKGFTEILLGNLVGSNIVNIIVVIGFTSVISPIMFSVQSLMLPIFFMLIVSFLLFLIVQRGYSVSRFFGGVFLALYVSFIYLTLFFGSLP